MPVCPTCGDDVGDAQYCPRDGTPLAHVGRGLAVLPEIGDVVDGRYRVEEVLGKGGMAVVLRARSEALGGDVAMKVLFPRWVEDQKTVARFAREARATSQIDHPNVVRVFDFGYAEPGFYFLTMELLGGEPLADLLGRQAPLPAARALRLLGAVAGGMARAHELGVVHRDLKPENVMVEVAGGVERVTIVDFGLSKVEEGAGGLITGEGDVIGTPDFMAPEQWQGQHVDARADVYSFGVMAYEMLSGELPYTGETLIQKLQQHLYAIPLALGDHPKARALPAGLSDLVMRCMAKDPLDRPPHMGRVNEAIDAIEESLRELSAEPTQLGLGGELAAQATQFIDASPVRPLGRLARLNEIARLERVREARLVAAVPRLFRGATPDVVDAQLELIGQAEERLAEAEEALALAEDALREAQRAHRSHEAALRARLVERNLELAVARRALPGEVTHAGAASGSDTLAMTRPPGSEPPAADDGEEGDEMAGRLRALERAERRLAAFVRAPDEAVLDAERRFEEAARAERDARPEIAARYAELERVIREDPAADLTAMGAVQEVDELLAVHRAQLEA